MVEELDGLPCYLSEQDAGPATRSRTVLVARI